MISVFLLRYEVDSYNLLMQTGAWNSCTNGGKEYRDEALLGG
jgi:hypothetical protein